MSKSKIHQGTWKVFGNRKSNRVFCATLPAQTASVGDRVKLESKAGVVTTGTLTELHSATDGLEFWLIDRDSKTAAEHAADRALRYESQAEFWMSDRGTETAERIRARAERKAQAATGTSEEPVKSTSTSEEPEQTISDEAATALAKLLAAKVEPGVAADAIRAAFPNAVQSTSTSTSTSTSKSAHGDCGACKRTDQPLTEHPAGVAVCNYCKSADVETITRRAARKAGQSK